MKNILLSLIVFISFFSCQDDDVIDTSLLDSIDRIEVVVHQIQEASEEKNAGLYVNSSQILNSPLRIKQIYTLKRFNNSWKQITDSKNINYVKQGKQLLLLSSPTYETKYYSLDIKYYDAKGMIINQDIYNNRDYYQCLLSISDYVKNDEKGKPTSNSLNFKVSDVFPYINRDIQPYGVLPTHFDAGFVDNGLMFKGITYLMKTEISFNLEFHLFKLHNPSEKQKGIFYLDQKKFVSNNSIKFTVPINVLTEGINIYGYTDDEPEFINYFDKLSSFLQFDYDKLIELETNNNPQFEEEEEFII